MSNERLLLFIIHRKRYLFIKKYIISENPLWCYFGSTFITRFLTIFLFGLLLEKKNCFSCYVDGTTLLLGQLMVNSRCVKTTWLTLFKNYLIGRLNHDWLLIIDLLDEHVENICQVVSKTLSVFSRLANYMSLLN